MGSVVNLALLLSIGACAGMLTSTLGIGASLVVVPALLFTLPLLQVPDIVTPAMALGTALTVSVFTAAATAWRHFRLGNLSEPFSPDKVALMLCAGAGAALGSSLATNAPPALALGVMALAQAVMGAAILRGTGGPRVNSHDGEAQVQEPKPLSKGVLTGVGFLTSIGAGGTLIAPYLALKGFQHAKAVALAGWLSVLIGATGLGIYASHTTAAEVEGAVGAVHLPAALLVSVGSFVAVRYGAVLVNKVNQLLLRRALGVILILSSGRIAFSLLA